MKRFLVFIFLAFSFFGCDDGELEQVSFEFNDSPAVACGEGTNNFFIYKIQDRRALIIQLPESSFENIITADLTTPPVALDIQSGSARLIYREYSDEVTTSTICSSIPASTPVVVRENEATAGKILVTTTAIRSEPDANGATTITNYLHTLTFSGVNIATGEESNQINESFSQISYLTSVVPFSPFAGLTGLNRCENDQTFLYKNDSTQALILDLSTADATSLFTAEAGVKTILISNQSTLRHLFYNTELSFLNNTYFCTFPTPETPPVLDTFTAQNGIANQNGIVEVTTTVSPTEIRHTIVLRNVRLSKGSLNVDLGNTFIYGEIIIPVT